MYWNSTIPTQPTQGSIPFTATQFLQAIPSLPVLFRVFIEDFPAPLDMFVRFLSSLVLSANYGPLPLLSIAYSLDPNQGAHHNNHNVNTTKKDPLTL